MFAQRLKPSAALRALKQALKLACSINGATAKRRPRCMETACLNLQAAQSNRQNRTLVQIAANGWKDEGFSMRATARGFGGGLTLARVDKPLKEEAVGC